MSPEPILTTPVISEQARNQFLEQGYLVVPDVVPADACARVIDAIRRYRQGTHGSVETDVAGHGIVPLHHHQALWDVRQLPSVYEAFCAIYQAFSLWVSMDRVSFKGRADRDAVRAPIHWDCDPWTFTTLSVQGLVYLTDTREDQGAFCCVPSIYRDLTAWCGSHRREDGHANPTVPESDVVSVAGAAGSLVIFHRLMPHSSGINRTNHERYVQYVTMQPAGTEQERQQRVREWEQKLPPGWAIRQKVEGQQIPEPGAPAELSALGKKLVGVLPWSNEETLQPS